MAYNNNHAEETLFPGLTSVEAHAVFIGHRLDMKALEHGQRLSIPPYVIRAGQNGYAVLFRYGVVVMFGLNAVEEAAFLKDMQQFVIDPLDTQADEDGQIVLDPEQPEIVLPDHVRLQQFDLARIQLVADVLAKSAVLSHYEVNIARSFDHIEPVANEMQKKGRPSNRASRNLLKHIGSTLAVQRKMAGHVEITEKPELLWERTEFERLFNRLEDDYEIRERYQSLMQKLDIIHKTAETMQGILEDAKALRAEWYIVILIVFDITLHLAEKYLGL